MPTDYVFYHKCQFIYFWGDPRPPMITDVNIRPKWRSIVRMELEPVNLTLGPNSCSEIKVPVFYRFCLYFSSYCTRTRFDSCTYRLPLSGSQRRQFNGKYIGIFSSIQASLVHVVYHPLPTMCIVKHCGIVLWHWDRWNLLVTIYSYYFHICVTSTRQNERGKNIF